MVSGVLADNGLDILDAVVATWPDGGTLDSFSVRRSVLEPARLSPEELDKIGPPDRGALEAGVSAALGVPIEVLANPDAEVRFDDDASPWYTLCEVRSPDRRGLLHSLTAGIASAGAIGALGSPGDDLGSRGGPLRADRCQRSEAGRLPERVGGERDSRRRVPTAAAPRPPALSRGDLPRPS